jgi:simple sugar transport system permease protein
LTLRRFEKGSIGAGAWSASLIALAAALSLAALLIVLGAADPGGALFSFFILPWSNAWFLGNTLDGAVLLMAAALGVGLAFQGGTFNLGGEGQIYLGGLSASIVLLRCGDLPPWLALLLAGTAALGTGGAMGAISGFLKRSTGADEMITSFLLSASLIPVADYAISGPLRDTSGSLLAMARIDAAYTLPRLMHPSSLNLSLVLTLFLVFAFYIFLSRTAGGYRFRIAGSSPVFARYAGIPVEKYWLPTMAASGAMHALAGFFAVAGTYGVCHRGFPAGLGWNAIAVSLIARNKPLALMPAALAYGWLKSGSDAALLSSNLGFETSSFIQALVLLLATVRYSRSWGPSAGKKGKGAAL